MDTIKLDQLILSLERAVNSALQKKNGNLFGRKSRKLVLLLKRHAIQQKKRDKVNGSIFRIWFRMLKRFRRKNRNNGQRSPMLQRGTRIK